MLVLPKGESHGIQVAPRWPSSDVSIDQETLQKLLEAQAMLPPGIELLLVRGYENGSSHLGVFRTLSRWLGIKVFCACYPGRKDEVGEIFGANGHDVDGSHVDVSIVLQGKRLRFLPLGVFTSLTRQRARAAQHLVVIEQVKAALKHCGFDIHRNETESMQIHCDYRPQKS